MNMISIIIIILLQQYNVYMLMVLGIQAILLLKYGAGWYY